MVNSIKNSSETNFLKRGSGSDPLPHVLAYLDEGDKLSFVKAIKAVAGGHLFKAKEARESARIVFDSKDTITLAELSGCGETFRSLKEFTLDLSDTQIHNMQLSEIIGRFPNIIGIKAHRCKRLNEWTLPVLANLKKLQSLDWGWLRVENLLQFKTALPKLQNLSFSLDLSRSFVDDGALDTIISDFPGITEINASRCEILTPQGFAHLARLKNLRSLDLSQNFLNDQNLSFLAKFTSLTNLNLSCNRIVNLGALSPLLNLESLDVFNTDVSDEGLRALVPLPKLHTLDLSFTRVSVDFNLLRNASNLNPVKNLISNKADRLAEKARFLLVAASLFFCLNLTLGKILS